MSFSVAARIKRTPAMAVLIITPLMLVAEQCNEYSSGHGFNRAAMGGSHLSIQPSPGGAIEFSPGREPWEQKRFSDQFHSAEGRSVAIRGATPTIAVRIGSHYTATDDRNLATFGTAERHFAEQHPSRKLAEYPLLPLTSAMRHELSMARPSGAPKKGDGGEYVMLTLSSRGESK